MGGKVTVLPWYEAPAEWDTPRFAISPSQVCELDKRQGSTGGSTAALRGSIRAVLKSDGPGSPTCVYNEFVASRLGQLLGVPLAGGTLTYGKDALLYASLIPAQTSRRQLVVKSLAAQAGRLCPSHAAALLVFDAFVGNWDRPGNAMLERGIAPQVFGFDHERSLLSARESMNESIEALGAGESVLSQHIFGHCVSTRAIRWWTHRFESTSELQLRAAVELGRPINSVPRQLQCELASALVMRLRHLETICDSLLYRRRPPPRFGQRHARAKDEVALVSVVESLFRKHPG